MQFSLSRMLPAAVLLLSTTVVFAQAGPGSDLLVRQSPDGGLAGWRSFHQTPGTKTGDVWHLGADGVLVCKGKPLGYLATLKDYTNFVLRLQWRWPPGGKAGKGGVLARMTGPDKIWPRSLEMQINAGQAGDFWGLAGYRLTGPAARMKSLSHPQFGQLTNLAKLVEAERPVGQWNDYEIRLEGPRATLRINGQLVNQAEGCDVVPGKILLTSEGDEIHFRNLRIEEK